LNEVGVQGRQVVEHAQVQDAVAGGVRVHQGACAAHRARPAPRPAPAHTAHGGRGA
jgi:hypothetical protein